MQFIRTSVLFLLMSAALPALTISLTPADGEVFGSPGGTVSWGFTITGDATNWLLITSVQSASPIEDVLSVFAGANSYALAPGLAMPWTESATPGLAVSAGALARFAIPAGALPGSVISGSLLVTYDLFDANPFANGNFVSSGEFEPLAFRVNVADATGVPEPGTFWVVTVAGLALIGRARLRHRAA